jgi:hypothetical protein
VRNHVKNTALDEDLPVGGRHFIAASHEFGSYGMSLNQSAKKALSERTRD